MKKLSSILEHASYRKRIIEDKEINTDSELYDYAEAILSKAHGDKYDDAQMRKMVSNLIDKNSPDGKTDYPAIVAVIQNSVSERIMETLAMNPSGGLSDPLAMSQEFEDFLHLCAIAQAFGELSSYWHKVNPQTLTSKAISDEIRYMNDIADKAFVLATYGAATDTKFEINVNISDDDISGRRLMPLIREFDEWKEFVKLNKTVTDELAANHMNLQLQGLVKIFLDHSKRLIDIVFDKQLPTGN